MTVKLTCDFCQEVVSGADLQEMGTAFIDHCRRVHPDFPYPDQAIRNYAEATQRLAPVRPRLDEIGEVTVHPVTSERIDDWLDFFDREAFAGKPEWAACFCTEPHMAQPGDPGSDDVRSWRENRALMVEMLTDGKAYGYLAYVDGEPAGWVNASLRKDYAMYREGPDADTADGDTVGVSCFVVAPAYRRHGVAAALLDRVIADARDRGARWIEGYPFNEPDGSDASGFRGPRSLYDENGFEPVADRGRHTVVRRPA